MGKLDNLNLDLAVLATSFALALKLASPGQIVVASLPATFIAVAIWKTSHCSSARHLSTDYQCSKTFVPSFSFLPFRLGHLLVRGTNYEQTFGTNTEN